MSSLYNNLYTLLPRKLVLKNEKMVTSEICVMVFDQVVFVQGLSLPQNRTYRIEEPANLIEIIFLITYNYSNNRFGDVAGYMICSLRN